MSKRRSTENTRCPRCRVHKKLCFCEEMSKLLNEQCQVTILMHHREDCLTTNTAILALNTLNNCKIVRRGLPERPFQFSDLEIKENEIPFYLFPDESASYLDKEKVSKLLSQNPGKKFHMIIPDGTWSQAKKVYRREKDLHQIPCLKIPMGIISEYQLRKSPREDGVCTYEAIMHALRIIESEELFLQMQQYFRTMVARFIKARTSFHN